MPRKYPPTQTAAAIQANMRNRRSRRIAELAADAEKLTDEQLEAVAAIARTLDQRRAAASQQEAS